MTAPTITERIDDYDVILMKPIIADYLSDNDEKEAHRRIAVYCGDNRIPIRQNEIETLFHYLLDEYNKKATKSKKRSKHD